MKGQKIMEISIQLYYERYSYVVKSVFKYIILQM